MTFLRNAWYAAAWSSEIGSSEIGSGEIGRTPLARTFLNEPVVLYRTEAGDPVAIGGVCPHRFAPLGQGRLVGDRLECPYHGLTFDGSGACVLNPHGNGKIPAAARVAAYPLAERHSLVWIWMGEAGLADPGLIPDFAFLTDPLRAPVGGRITMQAHYELGTDNLMDLSHTQWLHATHLKSDAFLKGRYEVAQDGDTVYSNMSCPDAAAPPYFRGALADPDGLVDQWFDMRWDAPALLRLDVGVTAAGQARAAGANSLSAHILTPETETTTHYFYCNARNYAIDDRAVDAHIREWQRIGFGEQDKPMIEAVQRCMGTTDLLALRPVLLPGDAGAVRARRVLRSLIDAEAALAPRAQAVA